MNTTYKNPREKTAVNICSLPNGSVFSRGIGSTRINTSVITCMMAYASQKYIRLPQFVGAKASQFRSIGRQINIVPNAPTMAQTNTKARDMLHQCWKLGSGKTRRYCSSTVAFMSVIAALYSKDAIQMIYRIPRS